VSVVGMGEKRWEGGCMPLTCMLCPCAPCGVRNTLFVASCYDHGVFTSNI
jgi:hypothetical protein